MSPTGAEAETDPTKRAQQTAWKRGLAVSDELRKSARAVRLTTSKPVGQMGTHLRPSARLSALQLHRPAVASLGGPDLRIPDPRRSGRRLCQLRNVQPIHVRGPFCGARRRADRGGPDLGLHGIGLVHAGPGLAHRRQLRQEPGHRRGTGAHDRPAQDVLQARHRLDFALQRGRPHRGPRQILALEDQDERRVAVRHHHDPGERVLPGRRPEDRQCRGVSERATGQLHVDAGHPGCDGPGPKRTRQSRTTAGRRQGGLAGPAQRSIHAQSSPHRRGDQQADRRASPRACSPGRRCQLGKTQPGQ